MVRSSRKVEIPVDDALRKRLRKMKGDKTWDQFFSDLMAKELI